MQCSRHLTISGMVAAVLTSLAAVSAERQVGADEVNFNRDVRPLLADRCFHCHGPDAADRQAGLRLDQAAGEEGAYVNDQDAPAITPGSLDQSQLWARINSSDPDLVMPPPDAHKAALTLDEIATIGRWIEQGAVYEDFWAFVPPTLGAPPLAEAEHSIDGWIRQGLVSVGLTPAPAADRRTLLRRLSLDLTGLPPTRQEIEAFLSDASEEAYERQVDRLLDSPHYGEHMARYWLDLVRFADTNGIHHDHYRELSPYRDWVIRAFNQNLPYDDFVRYQLAGDLFQSPSQDQLIASGFHRLHLIIDRGTGLPEESLFKNVIDRVTSVGTAFLGLSVQCASCHDHKYDPLTTEDFYALYAFFNNLDAEPETGFRDGTDFYRGLQPPYIDLPSAEQAAALERLTQAVDLASSQLAQRQAALERTEVETPEREAAQQQVAAAEAELKLARKKRDDLLLEIPAAMVMKERDDLRPTHVQVRGQYDKPGVEVQRGTPKFLPLPKRASSPMTRMELADWLVDPDHPLTSRVAVNRLWQQLFGVGIVRTSEDFGAQGEWPTHPELLDYLAVRFVESGWDIKSLLKAIVMTDTYRQAAPAAREAFVNDPRNRWLARSSRYRLDAEVIRDQILLSSGLLNRQLYGKSVKPPQPAGLWKAVGMPSSFPYEFVADDGDKIYRRSVYTFWKRGLPPPQMTILNAPTREDCIARRERTNTPLQALLLLNEPQYLLAARHLAHQVLSDLGDDAAAVTERLYETITSQLPSTPQLTELVDLAEELESLYLADADLVTEMCQQLPPPDGSSAARWAAWTVVASTIYNLDITRTRP